MSLLAALPAVSAAVSALTYKLVWLDGAHSQDAVPYVLRSCSQTISFASHDKTSIASLGKKLVCIRLTYLRTLFADRSGMGALMVYASVLVPLFLRLSYHAGSPNNRSFLQGPLLPSLALVLASLDVLVVGSGAALIIPTLVAAAYTFGAPSRKQTTSDLPLLPCPARAVYAANLTAVFMSFFLISTMLHDEESAKQSFWWESYVGPQFVSLFKPATAAVGDLVPLLVLPVLWLGYRGVRRPTTDAEARKELQEYLAPEVAYGFERTWAYYRQAGLLSFMVYVWGMSRLYRGVVLDHTLSAQAQYILLVSLSLVVTMFAIVAVDAQATPQNDALHDEALKAIKRAPAGNPGVEDNLAVLAVLAIVGGPSLAAMLWYARNEEIRGWKGRRAWRLNSASSNAIAAK